MDHLCQVLFQDLITTVHLSPHLRLSLSSYNSALSFVDACWAVCRSLKVKYLCEFWIGWIWQLLIARRPGSVSGKPRNYPNPYAGNYEWLP